MTSDIDIFIICRYEIETRVYLQDGHLTCITGDQLPSVFIMHAASFIHQKVKTADVSHTVLLAESKFSILSIVHSAFANYGSTPLKLRFYIMGHGGPDGIVVGESHVNLNEILLFFESCSSYYRTTYKPEVLFTQCYGHLYDSLVCPSVTVRSLTNEQNELVCWEYKFQWTGGCCNLLESRSTDLQRYAKCEWPDVTVVQQHVPMDVDIH